MEILAITSDLTMMLPSEIGKCDPQELELDQQTIGILPCFHRDEIVHKMSFNYDLALKNWELTSKKWAFVMVL